MANYREIFRSTGLLGSVQVLYVLLSVVRNKITAMLIGVVGMGLSDLYMRIVNLAEYATNFGLGNSSVKHLSTVYGASTEALGRGEAWRPTPDLIRQVCLIRSLILLTALLGGLALLAFSPLISFWTTDGFGQTPSFALLSLVVAFTTLGVGEIAILKATRQLKSLAAASVATAVATLVFTAVIYAVWGVRGIIPVLVLSAVSLFFLNFRKVRKTFPYRVNLNRGLILREGRPLIKLGMAYIISGLMASGVEMLIRAEIIRIETLNGENPLVAIGLYAAGFTLTISYEKLLFVAMDGDYFPRLSAIVHNRKAMNVCINRQVNTLTVLIVPLLLVFSLFLPLIVRIIYTAEFMAIVPMVRFAMLCMFFKAIYYPVAFIALASGHGRTYVRVELFSNIAFGLCVIGGYKWGGITGSGIGLALSHLLQIFIVGVYYARNYGMRYSAGTLRRSLLLFLLLLLGISTALLPSLWLQVGGSLAVLALCYPVVKPILRQVKRKS